VAEHWIKGAIKHPGALHRELGVPAGKTIPKAKLAKAAKAGGKEGQRARLAETLEHMHHSGAKPGSGEHKMRKPHESKATARAHERKGEERHMAHKRAVHRKDERKEEHKGGTEHHHHFHHHHHHHGAK
jgi:hypothetical protein